MTVRAVFPYPVEEKTSVPDIDVPCGFWVRTRPVINVWCL